MQAVYHLLAALLYDFKLAAIRVFWPFIILVNYSLVRPLKASLMLVFWIAVVYAIYILFLAWQRLEGRWPVLIRVRKMLVLVTFLLVIKKGKIGIYF